MGSAPSQGPNERDPRDALRFYWRWFVEKEHKAHSDIQAKFPRLTRSVDAVLEALYSFISKPWVGIVIGLLLVALVAADVINIIVLVSVWLSWLITVLGLSRETFVKQLTMPTRVVVLVAAGCLLAGCASSFASWTINQYNAHHETPIPRRRDDIFELLKRSLNGKTETTDQHKPPRHENGERAGNSENRTAKVGPHRPSEKAGTDLPVPKTPRLGTGPDAYKDVSDAQVAQWAIEESVKIEEMADFAIKKNQDNPSPPGSINAQYFFFTNDFNKCCAQPVKDLREEIFRRMGPPAQDTEEQREYGILFPEPLSIPSESQRPQIINPYNVKSYALQLTKLGKKLRNKAVPRNKPRQLSFSQQALTAETEQFPYKFMITINTESVVSRGYIVLLYSGTPARLGVDLSDVKYTEAHDRNIVNNELIQYLAKHEADSYSFAIGDTPFTPEKPIHIVMDGTVLVTVQSVTLFDE